MAEPDPGFFSNSSRDAVAFIGLVGTLATFLGLVVGVAALILTRRQIQDSVRAAEHATSVAEAASLAAIKATDELREQYNRFIVSHSYALLKEAKLFVQHEQWSSAALRLFDLAELFAQLTDQNEEWQTLATRLRAMEDTFRRIEKTEVTFKAMKTKWRDLHQSVSVTVGKYYGPFPQGEEKDK